MLFSILIPVYNVEKYLRKCLDSVVQQTFQDYEVILIDDGSTDESGSICEEYKAKYGDCIRVLHRENEGLLSARRQAFSMAQGKYCVCCDADDFLGGDALLQLARIIESEEPDMVIYNAYLYQNDQQKIFYQHIFEEGFVANEAVMDMLLLTYKINGMCLKAVKTAIVDKDRDYSTLYRYKYGEDLLQSIPLVLQSSKIYYLDRELYNYRQGSGMMSEGNKDFFWQYRGVNQEISVYKDQIGDTDFEQKLAVHMMVHTCGAIGNLGYEKLLKYRKEKKQILRMISEDVHFRNAYNTIKNTKYSEYLNHKQQKLLELLYAKNIWVLLLIMKAVHIKNKWKEKSRDRGEAI